MTHSSDNRLDRRRFLQLAGGATLGGAALSMLPGTAVASHQGEFHINPNWPEHKLWKAVKRAFVLDRNSVYMNIGTTGSMPRQVLKNYDRYNHVVAKDPWHMNDEWGDWPYTTELVADIAPQFGADPEQIVLSRNTTDGMCTILGGLNLQEGDVILSTHHEHIAALSPLQIAAERLGVIVDYLEIPVYTGETEISEDDFVQVFQQGVDKHGADNVALIVFSHITYKTGTRLPAKRICQEVAAPNNIMTLIDGAHSIGMVDLDFQDIGCDFYAGSGHKWQCGPGATGILYVRQGAEAGIDGYWPINGSLYPYAGFFNLQRQLQYVGNDNYPAKRALADSCRMWDDIGRWRIEEYVLGLSHLCKQRLLKTFGGEGVLYAPDVYALSSGLTTFNPFQDQTDLATLNNFRDRLREEYGFIIRTTDFKVGKDDPADVHALRISTHLFHDQDEVKDLVAAMFDLYQDMS